MMWHVINGEYTENLLIDTIVSTLQKIGSELFFLIIKFNFRGDRLYHSCLLLFITMVPYCDYLMH